MAIEIYSKANIGTVEHFGYLKYEECTIIRNIAEKLNLACFQFLPYGGDIIFNCEQARHMFKNEIPLLRTSTELTPKSIEALDMIAIATSSVSQTMHTFLIFEGD